MDAHLNDPPKMAHRSTTPSGKGKKNAELIRGISRYATDNASETMAEAFADIYANGENAQELSKEIKRLTLETLNKYKK